MIPKIIWHTYETKYDLLPENIKSFITNWIQDYPDFDHRYMDAEQRKDFVLKEFGLDWYNVYINLPHNVMRSDIWKSMVLYIHGGIYFDLDIAPVNRIESWLNNNYSIILFGDESEKEEFLFFYQVMASEPGHPVTKSVLDNMLLKLNSEEYKNENKYTKYFVFKYSAELAFLDGVNKILDPYNKIPKSATSEMYNNLDKSKELGFYCYSYDYRPIYDGSVFKNIDGANNWTTGYNSWWKEVENEK